MTETGWPLIPREVLPAPIPAARRRQLPRAVPPAEAARQLPFFGAETTEPSPADLAGLLAGPGRLGRMGGTARVSVPVDAAWRVHVLVAELVARGLVVNWRPLEEPGDSPPGEKEENKKYPPPDTAKVDSDSTDMPDLSSSLDLEPDDLPTIGALSGRGVAVSDGAASSGGRAAVGGRRPVQGGEREAEGGQREDLGSGPQAAGAGGREAPNGGPKISGGGQGIARGDSGNEVGDDRSDGAERAGAEVADLGKDDEQSGSAGPAGPRFEVLTAYSRRLNGLARGWPEAAAQLFLSGPRLRLWVAAAGEPVPGGYALGLDPAKDPAEIDAALVRAGLAGRVSDGGRRYLIMGKRRLARLAELVGERPAAAPADRWPGGAGA